MRGKEKMKQIYILLIFLINIAIFYSNVKTLSISYKEAEIIFNNSNFIGYYINIIIIIFGKNDLAVRGSIFIFHLFNLLLIYKISKIFLKKNSELFLTILLYSLIPGVIGFSLIINPTTIVITITLIFIYFHLKKQYLISYFILFLAFLIDNSFAILYISLIFYSLIKKDYNLLIVSFTALIFSLWLFGFITHGKPRGYFLDILGLYSAIFSPFLFFYFFYILYRDMVLKNFNIIWAIAFFSLILSIIISFRQKTPLEDFAPFVVISIPLLIKRFYSSYRIRLKQFRKGYKTVGFLIISLILINFFVILFNQKLYLFIQNPKKHFAYKFHWAKELAMELKRRRIYSINCEDKKLQLRLRFYNINVSNYYKLSAKKSSKYIHKVTLLNNKKNSITYFVTKSNRD